MDIAAKLREARALIEDSDRWTQLEYARDAIGDPTTPRSTTAVRWCAEGAVKRVHLRDGSKVLNLLREAARCVATQSFGDPMWVNDELGHAAVLSMFDEAIRLAEEEGKK